MAGLPRIGGIPLVAWKRAPILAADISDATAAGRALMTAANAAAQRLLLGIADVGDLRNYAVATAISLLGLTRPNVAVDEPFNAQPGIGNSVFNALGGTLAQSSLAQGGWFKLTTAGAPGSLAATHNNQRQILVTSPTAKKWLALFSFAACSAYDAASVLRLGLYDASLGTDNGTFLGFHGPTNPTQFGFFQEVGGVFSGVASTVARDLNTPHFGYIASDGAGLIYGSIDNESPASFASTNVTPAMIHMLAAAGNSGADAFAFGHTLLITE